MGEKTTQIFRSELPPPKSFLRRWGWRVGMVLAVLIAYRLLVWTAVHVIDEEAIEKRLDEWIETLLLADASIHRVDADLNVLGEAGLTIHDIVVKHPNDVEFEGNMLTIDPLNLRSPVWGLWGVRCKPEVRIRNMDARILWRGDGYDQCSLFGLADPVDETTATTGFPLGRFSTAPVRIRIRRSRLHLEQLRRGESVLADVSGTLTYDPRRHRLEGVLDAGALRVEWNGDVTEGSVQLVQGVVDLSRGKHPVRPRSLELLLRDAPVRLANLLWSGLVPADTRVLFSGHAAYLDGEVEIVGDVSALDPASLAPEGMRIHACRSAAGEWKGLRARAAVMDLTDVAIPLPREKSGWLQSLLKTFPAVQADAEEIRILGIPLLHATLKFGPSIERNTDMVMYLVGTAFGADDRQQAPAVTLLGLPALHCRPSGGKAEVLVARGEEPAYDDETPVWTSALTLNNLAIPTSDAGAFFRALATIPVTLSEVETLCRRAAGDAVDSETENSLALGQLLFSRLEISHEAYADGLSRITFTGRSPDLGTLAGGGSHNADGSFSMALTFRDVPKSLFRLNPGLSPDTREAILQQAASDEGLRIDFTIDGETERVRHRYVQDTFHRWSQQRARDAAIPVPPRPENR